MQPAVSAIVLAGGASSRMGFNKALAPLGHNTLIEQTLATVEELSPDVLIVANDLVAYGKFGVRVVPDVFPGSGSLGGVYSGLLAAQHEHSIVVGCDMPFLNPSLWQFMLSLPRDYDVLVPQLSGLTEPLHAIYSKRCTKTIGYLLKERRLKVAGFLTEVTVRYVTEEEIDRFDPEHLSFRNVNTPDELGRARLAWERRRGKSGM